MIDKVFIISLGLVLIVISFVYPLLNEAVAKVVVSGIGVVIIIWAIVKPCSHRGDSCDNNNN